MRSSNFPSLSCPAMKTIALHSAGANDRFLRTLGLQRILTTSMTPSHYNTGEAIVQQGEPGTCLYVLAGEQHRRVKGRNHVMGAAIRKSHSILFPFHLKPARQMCI